jgi:hypothetical protein
MDQSVTMGQTLLLQCLALGSGPLSYQWHFGDTELPDQTNRWLSVTNVQPDQAGAYRVVVASDFGFATSAVATVTITWPLPRIRGVALGTDGLSLSFYAFRGAEYVVECKEHLDDEPWLEAARQVGMDSEVTITDPRPPSRSQFYRVRVEQDFR